MCWCVWGGGLRRSSAGAASRLGGRWHSDYKLRLAPPPWKRPAVLPPSAPTPPPRPPRRRRVRRRVRVRCRRCLREAKVWAWSGVAADEGDAAADWLSAYLGKRARLVRYLGSLDPASDDAAAALAAKAVVAGGGAAGADAGARAALTRAVDGDFAPWEPEVAFAGGRRRAGAGAGQGPAPWPGPADAVYR